MQHETIDIVGLGNASQGVVIVADMLTRDGFVALEKLESTTIESQDNNGMIMKKVKLSALLRRTQDFHKLQE